VYSSAASSVSVYLQPGTASGNEIGSDILSHIEDIVGGGGDDQLFGDENNNLISGGSGDDYLAGGAGNDGLYGGDGNDALYGGSGNDVLDGEGGTNNQADYDGAADDYSFTRNVDDTVTVSHSVYGTDTLRNIDGVWFNGEAQWYSLDQLAP
jgi:Ca2+-binding RTX toxin-like protein